MGRFRSSTWVLSSLEDGRVIWESQPGELISRTQREGTSPRLIPLLEQLSCQSCVCPVIIKCIYGVGAP